MAKQKNWEETFPIIKQSVMACKFPEGTSEEAKKQVFNMLVRMLLDNSVCKPDGSTYRWRSSCLDYLLDVLPKLEEDEIQLLLTNRDSFYKKFCFSPSRKHNSLYSELKRKGVWSLMRPSDDFHMSFISQLYERYYAETGLSPYELAEEENIVSSFLDNFFDDSDILLRYLLSEN